MQRSVGLASCSPRTTCTEHLAAHRGLSATTRLLHSQSCRASRRRAVQAQCSLLWAIDHLQASAPDLLHRLPLAYERVALPCSTMNCGDVIYRSTLDPVLRMEQKGLNPQGIALLGLVLTYLSVTPGVLAGAVDYYILAPWQRRFEKRFYSKEDIKVGRKLATGGFGTVFKGELVEEDTEERRPVIVKKAKEFGEAEAWMNERLMRAAPGNFADFITAFDDKISNSDASLWLVWQYEGDYTLADLMQKKDFPYNLEPLLFGRELQLPKGPTRKMITIRIAMQQILDALKNCHSTGIVHRDVKPQNVIVSETDNKVKLIDLGAAADLRIGINYIPNEFLLDPRYAPPQQYIMSTQTPRAPPPPVAAMLSPILWRLNSPDKFDMYSAGMILLQMAFPGLRSDNNLIAFNRKLESLGWSLSRWRRYAERRGGRDMLEGFEVLDVDGGAAWQLLEDLLQYEPRHRLSAAAALRHRWFGTDVLANVAAALQRASSSVLDTVSDEWLEEAMARSGTRKVGGLTEAQLSDELGMDDLPKALRNASTTIAWWRGRQQDFAQRLEQKARLGRRLENGFVRVRSQARQTIREGRRKMKFLSWGRTN